MPRLFYAICPDDSVRSQILTISRETGQGRIVPEANLHMTLVFIGEVDERVQLELVSRTGDLRARSFILKLSMLEWWKSQKLACLTPADPSNHLIGLVNSLALIARNSGVRIEDRPYRPHVTFARKVKTGVNVEHQEIIWNVRDFSLLESITFPSGPEYRIIRSWPLS